MRAIYFLVLLSVLVVVTKSFQHISSPRISCEAASSGSGFRRAVGREDDVEEARVSPAPNSAPAIVKKGSGALGTNPRALGTNPRALGTNPRALGTNPRALGTNPRALGTNPRALGTNPKALRLKLDALTDAFYEGGTTADELKELIELVRDTDFSRKYFPELYEEENMM
jgi:hypothetical protein